jgi:hypothetical protein
MERSVADVIEGDCQDCRRFWLRSPPAPLTHGRCVGLWALAGACRLPDFGDMTRITYVGPRDNSPGRRLTFDLSVTIRRPPAAVFAFLADVQEHEPIPSGAALLESA